MKIAITGRIGCGKSEVTSELRKLGAFVLSADEINRDLLKSKDYLDKLSKVFPEAFSSGVFDKKALTRIVFSDDEKRAKLNSIAHPEILKVIEKESEGKENVFVEVPLLSEEWARRFDHVWLIESNIEKRRERVMRRDGRVASEVDAIFKSQEEYDKIVFQNCTVIKNDESIEKLSERVREEYRKI